MELWDAYDRDGNLTGETLMRGEPVPDGRYHLVGCVLVRHTDGDYLLMRRDLNKKTFPGYYEASVGGSVMKGETAMQGALRELQEETGIVAQTLTPYYNARDAHCIYRAFICETDWPKDQITLQEGETIAYLWVSREKLIEMMQAQPCLCAVQAGTRAYFGLETSDPAEEFEMLL